MPFLVGCLALGTPRFAILLVVLFSDYIGSAYETTLWPVLGFFFMPLTTLSYAFAMNSNGSVDGICGLSNESGRVTITMPHPERVAMTRQNSWHPADWGDGSAGSIEDTTAVGRRSVSARGDL